MIRWLPLVLAASCATGPKGAPTPANDTDPRDTAANASVKRLADWEQLYQSLSGLAGPCGAVGKTRDAQSSGVVLPLECFFTGDASKVDQKAAPVVAAIAKELKRMADRDFWIDVRTAAGQPDGGRLSSLRAAAIVQALVGEGVAPERLAAVVGFGGRDVEAYDGVRAPHAGAALVEIIVAPTRDEQQSGSSRPSQ